MRADIEIERTGDEVAVLTVKGEHDTSTAQSLRSAITKLLDEGVAVVIDLTPSTFADSSVLGVLLNGRRRARARDLGLTLVIEEGAAPELRRILDVTGLGAMIPLFAARDAAIKAALSP